MDRYSEFSANQGSLIPSASTFGAQNAQYGVHDQAQTATSAIKQTGASQDDQKIIEEIEKTIQGLLNLNIIDSLSESEGSAMGQAGLTGSSEATAERKEHGSPKSSGVESEGATNETSADVTDSAPSQPEESKAAADQAERQKYIDDCTALVMQRIHAEGVNDMDQLAVMLRDCLSQFAVAYTERYGAKTEEMKQSQEVKDNVKLKKAVKILYNRLTAIKLDRVGAQQTVLEQNRRLQRELAAKERQIQHLQQEQQRMRNFVQQLLIQSGQAGQLGLNNYRGPPGGGNYPDSDNNFFRGGDVF